MSAPLTRDVRQALRRIPVIIAEDLYATDAILLAELGIDRRELRTAIAILYAKSARRPGRRLHCRSRLLPAGAPRLPDTSGQAA